VHLSFISKERLASANWLIYRRLLNGSWPAHRIFSVCLIAITAVKDSFHGEGEKLLPYNIEMAAHLLSGTGEREQRARQRTPFDEYIFANGHCGLAWACLIYMVPNSLKVFDHLAAAVSVYIPHYGAALVKRRR